MRKISKSTDILTELYNREQIYATTMEVPLPRGVGTVETGASPSAPAQNNQQGKPSLPGGAGEAEEGAAAGEGLGDLAALAVL